MLHLLTCPYIQDKYAIITSNLLMLIVLLFAESALEVSPDQGVEGEAADLPEEELLGGEKQNDAGEVDELVADLEIGNLLLGLVEIIKIEKNKYLQLEHVGDTSLALGLSTVHLSNKSHQSIQWPFMTQRRQSKRSTAVTKSRLLE